MACTEQNDRIIRPAVLADAADIARVHVRSWQAAYRGILPAEFLSQLSKEERARSWSAAIADDKSMVLCAVVDSLIAGFCCIGPASDEDLDPSEAAELKAIYIDPDFWRRGLGSDLFHAAVTQKTFCEYKHLVTWVIEANAAAREFYKRLGFVFDGRRKVHDWGAPTPVIRYIKTMK